MKKLYTTLLFSTLFVSGAFAQSLSNERMVVTDNLGQTSAYAIDRISSISFPIAKGEAKAEISVKSVDNENVYFVVTRNEFAPQFKFDIMPSVRANAMTDEQLAAYVNQNIQSIYSQDFTAGEVTLSSFDAKPQTEYTAVTVGLDEYGTLCAVSRANFTTLPAVLVGSPKIEIGEMNIDKRQFSLTTTANADVKGYSTLAGEKGTMTSQFKQFAPMFGYSNFCEMVKNWGYPHEQGDKGWEAATDTWTDMQPGTDYEIFVQGWDVNDNYMPCDTINLTTKVLGGEGLATVNIALGDYKQTDWNGEQKYSQFITFTPNDQSSCYRFNVVKTEYYGQDPEGYQNELKQDPPMPMANWFFYEPYTTDFQIDPETDAVALAVAKNAKGEWGTVTVKFFSTPTDQDNPMDHPVTAPARRQIAKATSSSATIAQRERHNFTIPFKQGYAPKFSNFNTGVKMVQAK